MCRDIKSPTSLLMCFSSCQAMQLCKHSGSQTIAAAELIEPGVAVENAQASSIDANDAYTEPAAYRTA